MIGVFGGTLHCYLGPGGCRKQGLYFSRTLPRKPLLCEVRTGRGDDKTSGVMESELEISVSHDLAPKLDGAVLDFGQYNKMQRFVWASLPAVKGPQCTCLRSTGVPAGKRPRALMTQEPAWPTCSNSLPVLQDGRPRRQLNPP